ncbi:hypothetical protein EGJ55_08895 [Pseudomonas moraviensis]|nr:hypothetical protein EGJ55_08895 [Pseudomonas moraviensis]
MKAAETDKVLVGASLLAKAVYQQTSILDRSYAPRGNASTDALRSALKGTPSVLDFIPTQSVGTISRSAWNQR